MMKAFLIVYIMLSILTDIGRAISLLKQDTVRDLSYEPWNIGLSILFIVWAAYLLGELP
jgi:hypothetical protein